MIIHQPEITVKDGQLKVSARVETEHQRGELPETLWFSFPESYADYVTDRSDGFLSSLFALAMYLGEDVEVRGTVSPQLADGIGQMVGYYQPLLPRFLQRISVRYGRLEAMRHANVAGGVAASFSGGIDSFYTLRRHLSENQSGPDSRLTHGLFLHGFDMFLGDRALYEHLYQRYAQLFSDLGLNLLRGESNMLYFFRNRIPWTLGHYGPAFGTMQVLGRLFSHYYKPGGDEIATGRTFLHLYSTETLEVGVDAVELGRIEKLEQMKDWRLPQKHLRVCMRDDKTADGSACYRCEKCLNTLVYLELLGIREKFSNFPQPLTLLRFLHFRWINFSNAYYLSFLPRYLVRERRFDLLTIFWVMFLPVELKLWLKHRLIALMPKRWVYALKKRVFGDPTAR